MIPFNPMVTLQRCCEEWTSIRSSNLLGTHQVNFSSAISASAAASAPSYNDTSRASSTRCTSGQDRLALLCMTPFKRLCIESVLLCLTEHSNSIVKVETTQWLSSVTVESSYRLPKTFALLPWFPRIFSVHRGRVKKMCNCQSWRKFDEVLTKIIFTLFWDTVYFVVEIFTVVCLISSLSVL